MHSFNALFVCASASLLSSTLALPTVPSALPLDRRACQVSYPTSMVESTPFHTAKTEWDFCISYDKQVRYANFNDIPSTARGACQLEFIFPAGYDVANSQSRQINVWKTDRPIEEADTWDTAPEATTLFGTVTLKSNPTEETRIVVNSGECASMKHFKFTIADNKEGGVVYRQQYPPTGPAAGMRIVHSC
ncbi:hypothetical protein BKA66DRAFT_467784 [Pyrenochaeta sp. MPI-SDFR-AT-0127]|nr:hypothetical protein BKA66DRAFT_467784 [Pyrenochaeta sp. MPI-SDFR-AT-0127]